MFRNQRLLVCQCFFEFRQSGFISDIAKRHADIAKDTSPFGANHRRAGETLLKSGIIELQQFKQIRLRQILLKMRPH